MSDHLFALGQTVAASGMGVPPGPYRITRLLPVSHGVPQYRGKSVVDEHERALSEAAIKPVPRSIASERPVRPAPKKKR